MVAANTSGSLILSVQNIPQIGTFSTVQGTVLGEAYSHSGSWVVEFAGSPTAGVFEVYPAEEQNATIVLDSAAIVSSLQMRLKFVGSDFVGSGAQVLPAVQYPGAVTVRVCVTYEEL